MIWSQALLVITTLLAILYLTFYTEKNLEWIKTPLIISLAAFALYLTLPLFLHLDNPVYGWLSVISTTLLFVSISALIRELKPLYNRYPVGFSLFPLLILIVYPFISDQEVLRQLLIQILQGGGLLIGLLIVITLLKPVENSIWVLTGIILIAVSYGIYWFIMDLYSLDDWIWQVILAGGLLFSMYYINNIFTYLKQNHFL